MERPFAPKRPDTRESFPNVSKLAGTRVLPLDAVRTRWRPMAELPVPLAAMRHLEM